MDIRIKDIGHNQGTCGWLKDQLEAGTLLFQEGVSKSGSHGLWLNHKREDGKKDSMLVAIYNPFDLEEEDRAWDDMGYQVMEITGGTHPGSVGNLYDLTPAAIRIVQQVAQEWCDKHNGRRSADIPLYEVKVVFEEKVQHLQ